MGIAFGIPFFPHGIFGGRGHLVPLAFPIFLNCKGPFPPSPFRLQEELGTGPRGAFILKSR
jgi:hypothetical protein